MKTKAQYKVKNWNADDASLKQRGSITFWVNEEIVEQWRNQQKTGRKGASNYYKDQAVHVVVDSTGLKVYGEGEWKVRTHGVGKRRTWRKLHLGIDEGSGEILAAVVTTNDLEDCEVLPDLLEQIEPPIKQVSGDGGYDTKGCYDTISQHGAKAIIPPRSNARMQQPHPHSQPHPRDENLRRVNQVGRKQWKQGRC